MKVVWICHFSNQNVREKLPLSKMKLRNIIKTLLGKKIQQCYSDFAPWITNQIKEFEIIHGIELHVIVPHSGLKRFTHEFEMNHIYYHFF